VNRSTTTAVTTTKVTTATVTTTTVTTTTVTTTTTTTHNLLKAQSKYGAKTNKQTNKWSN